MSPCPPINFQVSIISEWLAKHISTKFSLKITNRKRHVYIDIGWPWIWNQCFYFRIWNDDRTKMIVLPWFQLAVPLNSLNTNETEFTNEFWHINFFMNIGISIGIIEVSTSRKCCFYFISVPYTNTELWAPETL
jgi:hypothetical protein